MYAAWKAQKIHQDFPCQITDYLKLSKHLCHTVCRLIAYILYMIVFIVVLDYNKC